jgi:hypothetical protein
VIFGPLAYQADRSIDDAAMEVITKAGWLN